MSTHFSKRIAFTAALTIALAIFPSLHSSAQQRMVFATPEDAVTALITALKKNDNTALSALLGPGSEDVISSGDDVADANAHKQFVEDYEAKHSLVKEEDGSMTLQVGEEEYPLPIPIVAAEGKWYLDGAAGAQELIYRRVGRNELGAISVCRGFIDAQIEYAAQGHDGNPPGIFAAKLRSDPGMHNGLYWPTTETEAPSPAGKAVARAMAEGYKAVTGKRKPYHGYFYRGLFAQGTNAEGGAREYFVDGVLAEGVALIAWPADYGASGVMTFIVNLDGVVYQQDLGEDTAEKVSAIQEFNPDSSWTVVESQVDF